MRKIECACGISHQIYDWPAAEVEQNDKKMMERHLKCRCSREIVVRTAPKYEPDAEVDEDEKVATVTSFAELSRQFGVLKEADPHNKPIADSPDEAPSAEKSVGISDADRTLFMFLIENYAKWFKQGKASAKDQKKFFELNEKVGKAEDGKFSLSEEEIRMSKMAVSQRNIFHVFGEEPTQEDQDKLNSLKSALKEILA
jgi:hypothetical protein